MTQQCVEKEIKGKIEICAVLGIKLYLVQMTDFLPSWAIHSYNNTRKEHRHYQASKLSS